MCGRFETNLPAKTLIEKIIIEYPELEFENDEVDKKTNIAPTDKVLSIYKPQEKYRFTTMNWGIKFKDDSPLIFNSRIETIKEKSYWKDLYDLNRCLVPMTGFYEWKKEGNKKIPYRMRLKEYDYFFVPALYYKKNNYNFLSLITTVPNTFMKDIHHRMPVILTGNNVFDYFHNKCEDNLSICLPLNDNIQMLLEPVQL